MQPSKANNITQTRGVEREKDGTIFDLNFIARTTHSTWVKDLVRRWCPSFSSALCAFWLRRSFVVRLTKVYRSAARPPIRPFAQKSHASQSLSIRGIKWKTHIRLSRATQRVLWRHPLHCRTTRFMDVGRWIVSARAITADTYLFKFLVISTGRDRGH